MDVTWRQFMTFLEFNGTDINNNIVSCYIVILYNTAYGLNLPVQSKCGKIWTRKSPNTNIWYAVYTDAKFQILYNFLKNSKNLICSNKHIPKSLWMMTIFAQVLYSATFIVE